VADLVASAATGVVAEVAIHIGTTVITITTTIGDGS
jgi:hypothetical protein